MTVKLRAPFRYWGAKVRMAPWVLERLPEHNHFIESCAGSAAVLAIKPPVDAETVNDTYSEVVNFFRVLRDPALAASLIDLVAFTPYSQAEFIAAGEVIHDKLDLAPEPPDVERAWAFFVRMMMAVVPGRTGWQYGVGGAATKKANKPGRWATMPELLRQAAQRFERVQVTQFDILELIARFDAPGVLHLVDPPYLNETRPTSTGASSGYAHDAFDHGQFIKAALAAEHASFAITHYPHSLYDEAGFTVAGDFVSHRNRPNGAGAGREDRAERLYVLDRSRRA